MSLQRGLLLFGQSRYDLAETELRRALGDQPDDAYAHAMLALTLLERKQHEAAADEARQAVHLAPDEPFSHYALAKVAYERDRYAEARAAIDEAIRLDPIDPDHRFLLGAIHYDQRAWSEALEAAEAGLAIDAEHAGCANLRAMTLVKLGRREEAGETLGDALARDPQNPATHANQGWTLLHRQRPAQAVEHFRESLRLDPGNEYARVGLVEALKARNPVYGVMLRYFLWMMGLSPRMQWGVIVGGYFANRVLAQMAQANPELAPWLLPLRILYGAFVVLTWTAEPIFNLLLRLSRDGRYALSREEVSDSNWIGGTILAALASLLAYPFTGQAVFLLAAMVFGFLVIPLAGTLRLPAGKRRRTMGIYTGALLAVGLGSVAAALLGRELAAGLFVVYVVATFASTWVLNVMMMARTRQR